MDNCCEDKACALDALQQRQGATLRAVLAINTASRREALLPRQAGLTRSSRRYPSFDKHSSQTQ